MCEMRREPGVDYFQRWQTLSLKLSEAKKRNADLVAAMTGADAVPMGARRFLGSMEAICTAGAKYFQTLLDSETDERRRQVLEGQVAKARQVVATLQWFNSTAREEAANG